MQRYGGEFILFDIDGPSLTQRAGNNGDVELESLTAGAASSTDKLPTVDPNFILNECTYIDQGITEIQEMLARLDQAQRRTLADTDTSMNSPSKQAVEKTNNEILAVFRELTGQIKRVKSRPEAGQQRNAPQIGRVTPRLKDMRQQYQSQRNQFEHAVRDQAKKQARIVMQDASEAEINAFVDNPANTQLFSQALMQSNRRGEAQSTLNAVSARHAEIQKIEQQMIELAELFQEMESLVVQQEVNVVAIETKGEEVQDNLVKGNEEMGIAVKSARAARRKKWWCLLIVVILIIIVVVVVLVIVKPGSNKSSKRSIEAVFEKLQSRAVVPGGFFYEVHDIEDGTLTRRALPFAA